MTTELVIILSVVKSWFERNKNFQCHFTPTSASWLNMVERSFRDISESQIKRGVFKSITDMERVIENHIVEHNKDPKPFIWTAKASDIFEKVKRGRKSLDKLHYV